MMLSKKQMVQLEYGVAVILIVLAAGFAWWWYHKNAPAQVMDTSATPTLQSHQVFGQIQSYANNRFVLSGVYVRDVHPELTNYANKSQIGVYVTSDTKYVKTTWNMPSQATLAASKGQFDPAKIPKTTSQGSLDDLRNVTGMAITAKTTDNVWGMSAVTASVIDYNVYVYAK